jgi:hypothetical protein
MSQAAPIECRSGLAGLALVWPDPHQSPSANCPANLDGHGQKTPRHAHVVMCGEPTGNGIDEALEPPRAVLGIAEVAVDKSLQGVLDEREGCGHQANGVQRAGPPPRSRE